MRATDRPTHRSLAKSAQLGKGKQVLFLPSFVLLLLLLLLLLLSPPPPSPPSAPLPEGWLCGWLLASCLDG